LFRQKRPVDLQPASGLIQAFFYEMLLPVQSGFAVLRVLVKDTLLAAVCSEKKQGDVAKRSYVSV